VQKKQNYYCPKCGLKGLRTENCHKYQCDECEFQFYKNVAATASIVLRCDDEVLFSRRGREPAKGLLDFPGGFVDPGESLEAALTREIKEELDWTLSGAQYLFSFPNTYLYAEVLYSTADAFFLCDVTDKPNVRPQDDVDALIWLKLGDVMPETLAFDSMKKAVTELSSMDFSSISNTLRPKFGV